MAWRSGEGGLGMAAHPASGRYPSVRVVGDPTNRSGRLGVTDTERDPGEDRSFLLAIVDATAEMIVVTDDRGTITWSNASVRRILGLRETDIIGHSLLEFVHPDELHDVANSFTTTLSRPGPAAPLEVRVRTGDHRWRFCEVVGSNQLNVPGVNAMVWSARDVTGRLEAQRRFRRLFEANPLPTVLMVTGSTGVFANQAFASLLGYSREELMHVSPVHLVPDNEVEDSLRGARELVEGDGTSGRYDIRLKRKDGTTFMADLSVSVTRHDDELAILVTVNDVTEWREAVRALGESQARLETLLDHSPDIIAFVQSDGYWSANLTATRLLGYPKGFDPPEGILHMVYPDDREAAWAAFIDVIEGRRDPDEPFVLRLQDVQGNVLWHECRARPLPEQGAAVVTARDLTMERDNTRRRLEHERLLANEIAARERAELETRMEHAMRLESVGRLSAGLAHDFNNLAGVILNYANVVERNSSLDKTALTDIAAIVAAAEQAVSLTHSLLQFGHEGQSINGICDLQVVVRALEPLLAGAMRSGQTCTITLGSEPALVPIERSQCEQLVMNLVMNSRDALTDIGAVDVTVSTQRINGVAYSVLEVADGGSGMTDDVAKRAFDPFFTTKPTGVGSGLGLAIVHGIVESSGGVIRLQSKLGSGTRVQIRWSAVAATSG